MTDPLLTSLFEHKAWANRGLFAALAEAPAEQLASGRMAVALLTLDHFNRVDRVFRDRLEGRDAALETVVGDTPPVLAELAERVAQTDAWYSDYAAGVDPAELDEIVEFTFIIDGEPGHLSKRDILAHVLTHAQSHRGAVGQMLERMGVDGASDMFTTFRSRG